MCVSSMKMIPICSGDRAPLQMCLSCAARSEAVKSSIVWKRLLFLRAIREVCRALSKVKHFMIALPASDLMSKRFSLQLQHPLWPAWNPDGLFVMYSAQWGLRSVIIFGVLCAKEMPLFPSYIRMSAVPIFITTARPRGWRRFYTTVLRWTEINDNRLWFACLFNHLFFSKEATLGL